MHHLVSDSCILVIDWRGIGSSFHLEKESALYKSSFKTHTLLTSFDINSLWHKMPFSQRSHVTSYLMWPCWWCRTRCCNVSQLGHHCRLPMPHSQNEYELLCLCSRSSNLTYEGYVSPNHRTPSQWPPPRRSDTDVQVTAPTWRAIIAARQAICRWGEEADNSGPCLSYNKQPQHHLTPEGDLLL